MTRAGALYPIDDAARFPSDRGAHVEELRALRIAATRDFPFVADTFSPAHWRFATRNRLGMWEQVGSLAPVASVELDAALEQAADDWVRCSEQQILYFAGISSWSNESRDALVAMFLAKQLTKLSLPQICKRFGNRYHTTVMHALR